MGMRLQVSNDGLYVRYRKTPAPHGVLTGPNLFCSLDDYVVVDIETTGLDASACEIIELAALRVRGGVIEDVFDSLVRPTKWYVAEGYNLLDWTPLSACRTPFYVSPFITQLTHITDGMLESAPALEEVLLRFAAFAEDSALVGHNVRFDLRFLANAYAQVFAQPLRNGYLDTLRIARRLLREQRRHRLGDVAASLGVSYEGAHRAAQDCRITYACYERMKREIEARYGSFEAFAASKPNGSAVCVPPA